MACNSLNCVDSYQKFRTMKTTILLFAVIFGCLTPAYSQLNRHPKASITSELLHNKLNERLQNKGYDPGNYKFGKFSDPMSYGTSYSLHIFPTRRAQNKVPEIIYSEEKMPCFHPKSGDQMPCYKPTGTFHMRVFKPNDVIWGILF
jgi:hypothetical protein